MLASTLGLELDPATAWDERKQRYEHAEVSIHSNSITAAAEGDESGQWTCAVALAVFRFTSDETAP